MRLSNMEFSIPVPSPDEFVDFPRHTAVPCRQNSAGPPRELGGATGAGHFWRATPHRTYGCPQQLKVQQARPSFIKARPRGSSRGRALGSPSFPVGRARGRKGGLSHGEGAPLPVSGSSANMFGGSLKYVGVQVSIVVARTNCAATRRYGAVRAQVLPGIRTRDPNVAPFFSEQT